MAAADRRRLDNNKQPGGMVGPPGPQPPLTHHHTMNSAVASQQPNSIATQSPSARPGLDRAHTFPTPPTSASGTVTGMGNHWSSYESGSSGMPAAVPNSQFEHHPHSTPATPASTPPGSSLPSLQPYQGNQSYDTSRPIYAGTAPQQPQYTNQGLPSQAIGRTGSLQSNAYGKQDMGPPNTLSSNAKSENEHSDQKLASYMSGGANDHSTGEEESEHDHETDYGSEQKYSYDHQRSQYSSLNGHHTTGNQVNPLSGTASQSMWAGGYQASRAPPSSNLYNPTSDTRGALSNGNVAPDGHITGAYAPTQLNGLTSNKRSRDDDDSYSRNNIDDMDALKRRKMSRDGTAPGALANSSYDDTRQINRTKANATPRGTRR